MTATTDLSAARLYTDLAGLERLRAEAGRNSPRARKEVARQFEALFIQQALKAMRQAGAALGEGEGQQVAFYRELYDHQIAIELAAGRGIGLARAIERQLTPPGESPASAARGCGDCAPLPRKSGPLPLPQRTGLNLAARARQLQAWEEVRMGPARESEGPRSEADAIDWPPQDRTAFVRTLWSHARAAARRLGVATEVLLAQAALESGWGRHVPRGSHNLFGIKADGRWEGPRVAAHTLEYRHGVAVRERSAFRAYASPGDSLSDYAEFIRDNPRYRRALERGHDAQGYLRELQAAGYATDPHYADKIQDILRSSKFRQAVAAARRG